MAEENTEENVQELSGTEKSAILMMLLGEDEAAAVLQKLTPREVQHLGTAMYSVTGVDQTTVNAVLALRHGAAINSTGADAAIAIIAANQ